MSNWIVGVDAGGTNTRAEALDVETGQRRASHAAGANWTVHGPKECGERINLAVDQVLSGKEPAAMCLTIAGYYPPDHQTAAESWARALWPECPVRIEPDVLAAWAGAHAGEAGIVLISGTGSICYGQSSEGASARAGGWGPLFGDEGSAYQVGVQGLRRLAMEVDGIVSVSELSGRVLARWPELGVEMRDWLRGVYRTGWGREQVAEVATEVSAAAADGDVTCQGLIFGSALGLARQALAVEGALGEADLPLAVQGGFGRKATGLLRNLEQVLSEKNSRLRLVDSALPPLAGALLLAADCLGGRELQRRVREVLS